MADSTQESGGFLPQNLPSPAPSNFSVSPAPSNLPHPRSHPLRAGSSKEAAARRYVESKLLHISRRYTKKFQPPEEGEDVHGYDNMADVCKDLGEVVDVLWLSGTRKSALTCLSLAEDSFNFGWCSKLTDSFTAEHCWSCDNLHVSLSTGASSYIWLVEEARLCLCQSVKGT
jgi:hypothetical protein